MAIATVVGPANDRARGGARPRPWHASPPPRRAFVLPMTLLVIALTAIVLVGIARRSLMLADRAATAELNLQRTWGAISCQRALLEDAETWLTLPADASPGPLRDRGHRRFVFSLGGLEFDVLLGDESAKVNLNAMMELLPLSDVRQMATELAQSTPPMRADLRPFSFASLDLVAQQPREQPPEQPPEQPRLKSWGQVFPPQQFADPVEAPRLIAAGTVDLTCWGDGKLCLNSASDAALQVLCGRLASSSVARKLLIARSENPQLAKDALLATLDLDPEDFTMLASVLRDESTSFSMWLKVSQGSRGWYEFSVVSVEQSTMLPTQDDQPSVPHSATRPRTIPLARFSW